MSKFKSLRLKKIIFCTVSAVFFTPIVFAADPLAQIPSAFDPGLFGKNIRSTLPGAELKTSAPIQREEAKPSPFPEGDKIRFTLKGVRFVGNCVFSQAELKKIFAPSFHKNISLNDLQALVDAVTKKYRAEGYILSRAILPPQEINNGVVKVQVIEGYINKFTIEGDPGTGRIFLNAYGNHVLQSRPLKISVLEHEMLLANDIPGLTVRAVLKPSAEASGAADLTLVTTRKLIDAYYTYDNYGTRFLGPLQNAFGIAMNSAIFPGDRNAINLAQTTRGRELRYGEFAHSQPLGTRGLNLVLGTSYTQTEPQFILAPLDILARSFLVYANLTYPVIRTRTKNLILRGSANYMNVNSTILTQPYYNDLFRTLSFGAAYDTYDNWHGTLDFGADLEQGFDIWGATKHFLQSRPKGNPRYTKFNFAASRIHQFSPKFSLLTALNSQISAIPLLASEQFSYGGPVFGRGYGPSEIVGDRGFAGKAELRLDTFPEFKLLKSIQFFTFYDFGVVWNLDSINLIAKQSAASMGVGTRFVIIPQLYGEAYLAKPTTHKAITLTPPGQDGFQGRGFFQLVAQV